MARPKVLTPAQARRIADGKAPDMTEAEWQGQVLQLAEQYGWHLPDRTIPDDPAFVLPGLAWHPTLAKWSMRGWPDLTMVRARPGNGRHTPVHDVVFAELKSRTGKVKPRQAQVLALLGHLAGAWSGPYGAVMRVTVAVWRPDDLATVALVLA